MPFFWRQYMEYGIVKGDEIRMQSIRRTAALLAVGIAVLAGLGAGASDGVPQSRQTTAEVQHASQEAAEGSGEPAEASVQTERTLEELTLEQPVITRGVLAALLYEGDDRDAWAWVQQHELLAGIGTETDIVTREQAIYAMLRKCFVQSWRKLSSTSVRYADHSAISPAYTAAVYTAQQAGLIPAGGMLHPEELLTREAWSEWQEYAQTAHPEYSSSVGLISHRGYHERAPENTLEAFRQSAWNGYTTVECDVRFTRDGVPVLLHDPTVDRTSNGTGRVADKTFEQVRRLDFGRWKGNQWKNTRIPTFAEFLSVCRRYHLTPYVELKTELTGAQARNLLRICRIYGIAPTWISFQAQSLQQIAAVNPEARLGLLWNQEIRESTVQMVKSLQSGKNEVFLDADWNKLSEQGCNLLLTRGIRIEAYTVDGRLDELRRRGVRGVTTNRIMPRMLAIVTDKAEGTG